MGHGAPSDVQLQKRPLAARVEAILKKHDGLHVCLASPSASNSTTTRVPKACSQLVPCDEDSSFDSASGDQQDDDDSNDGGDSDNRMDAINSLSLAVLAAPDSPMRQSHPSDGPKRSASTGALLPPSSKSGQKSKQGVSQQTSTLSGPPRLLAVRLIAPSWRLPVSLTADAFSFLSHDDLLSVRLVCKLFLHVIRSDRRFESVHVRTMAPKKARRRRRVQFVPEGNQTHLVSKYDHFAVDWLTGKPQRTQALLPPQRPPGSHPYFSSTSLSCTIQ